jgi:hypothetical protein
VTTILTWLLPNSQHFMDKKIWACLHPSNHPDFSGPSNATQATKQSPHFGSEHVSDGLIPAVCRHGAANRPSLPKTLTNPLFISCYFVTKALIFHVLFFTKIILQAIGRIYSKIFSLYASWLLCSAGLTTL